MNSTLPITLKSHVTAPQVIDLKQYGIEIVSVDFNLIARCRTDDQQARVNAVNQATPEQQAERASKPIEPIKKIIGQYYYPEDMEDDYLG